MNCVYIDGGIADNFPLHLSNNRPGEKILAINMLPNKKGLSDESVNNITEYTFHILNIPMRQLVKNQVAKAPENCDIIQLMHEDSFYDFSLETKEKLEMFSKGYQQAKNFFERL